MESREILVACTKTQTRKKIMSTAETLAELMVDLDNNGIDYTDMTFTEGITKTQLLDPATQLPKDVMYKGNPTNNLIILLTNTRKKIASGIEKNRVNAYKYIQENGLQSEIIEEYGKNYTLVSNSDLWAFIDQKEEEKEEEECTTTLDASTEEDVEDILNGFKKFLYLALDNHLITFEKIDELIDDIRDIYDNYEPSAPKKNKDYTLGGTTVSDEDVDNMINELS